MTDPTQTVVELSDGRWEVSLRRGKHAGWGMDRSPQAARGRAAARLHYYESCCAAGQCLQSCGVR